MDLAMDRRRPRHLVMRRMKNGVTRYYWQPSKAAKAAGFEARALGEALDAAVRKAENLNAQWDAWRRGEESARFEIGDMDWLVAWFQTSAQFRTKTKGTQKVYRWASNFLDRWWEGPVDDMEPEDIEGLWIDIQEEMSDHSAAIIIRVLRMMLNLAHARRKIDYNAGQGLRLKRPKPRMQIWEPEELEAFVKAASPSMARAAVIAHETSQRPIDIRAMTAAALKPESAIRVRQIKTGALIDVALTQPLREQLDRRPADSLYLCPGPNGGQWKEHHFLDDFHAAQEASGIRAELQFRDLRRTCVVRLGEAGCTIPEICAITGHSLETATEILETYLPRSAVMAASGVAKLENARRTKVGTPVASELEPKPKTL